MKTATRSLGLTAPVAWMLAGFSPFGIDKQGSAPLDLAGITIPPEHPIEYRSILEAWLARDLDSVGLRLAAHIDQTFQALKRGSLRSN